MTIIMLAYNIFSSNSNICGRKDKGAVATARCGEEGIGTAVLQYYRQLFYVKAATELPGILQEE